MAQSEPTLAGLRLLLTRPAGQSADWRRDLQALGATLSHVPVLLIESIPMDEETVAAINNLQQYDIGIFVSTNAVRYAYAGIVEQQKPIPNGLQCYAVGDKTTNAALKAGFNVLATGAVDSDSLLSLSELQQLQGKRVLVFRGQGGRELITQTVRARGAEVTHAELYRRGYPHEKESELGRVLTKWRPHIVCVTSVAGVHNLIRMAHAADVLEQLQATPLLVPGDRVAAAAQANAFAKVLTARSMRFTDVSYALCDWWRAARVGAANN
ncbi:MAG: uroporphyrinogen-III synthase [Pseudomonadales bacterium]